MGPQAHSRTMLLGMALGFLMNATWLMVGIGVLPLKTARWGSSRLHEEPPATTPWRRSSFGNLPGHHHVFRHDCHHHRLPGQRQWVSWLHGRLTSHHLKKNSPLLSRILAFGPPLIIAWSTQHLPQVHRFPGGFGIVTCSASCRIIALRKASSRREKSLAVAMLLQFGAFFLLETAQEWNAEDLAGYGILASKSLRITT